jgi:oligosaccharide repeat unit polymerase
MSLSDLGWIVLFMALAGASYLLSRQRYSTGLSPLSVFVGVNSLSLAAYHLRLLNLNQISTYVQLLVLLGFLAFFLGSTFVGTVQRPEREQNDLAPPAGLSEFLLATGMLSFIGWVLPLMILVRRSSPLYLLEHPWVLQDQFQMRFICYLNVIGIVVLPIAAAKWALTRRVSMLDLVVTASALTGLLLAGIKQFLVFSAVSAVFTYATLRPRKIRAFHLLALASVFLVFFLLYDRTIDVFVNPIYQGSRFPPALQALEKPFCYLVGGWPAMDHVVNGNLGPQPVFAYITLEPLWKILGSGLGLMQPVPDYLPFVRIADRVIWNVYSLIGEVYWDFGVLGVIGVCGLLGFVSTGLYTRARIHRSAVSAIAYGLVGYGLAISFFSYYFRFGMLVLLLYVAVGGHLFMRREPAATVAVDRS